MKYITPDARLQMVASLVPLGARLADVGSDHAYLPVYLMRLGRIKEALATDVNEGPIRRAEKNIAEAGYAKQIRTRKCDGLDGVEDFAPDTVTICGMGGELVASILDKSAYAKKNAPLLILQPMTQVAFLRRYLAKNGYEIINEQLSPDEHRIYQIIVCRYAALPEREMSPLAELAGEKTAHSPFLPELYAKLKRQYTEIIAGKKIAEQSTEAEERILWEISQHETH